MVSDRAARWALSLLLPAGTMAAAHAFFTPHYLSDDRGMSLLASGVGFTSEPSPFLMFINPLVGQLLAGLYRAWPSVPWYGPFMHAVMLAAGVCLCLAVLSPRPTVPRAALLLGYFLTFGLAAFVGIQFTLVAAMCGHAALAWWWSRREAGWGVPSFATFLALVGMTALIRSDCATMTAVFAAPLVLLDLWTALRSTDSGTLRERVAGRWWATGLPLLAGVAVVVGLSGYHHWFYRATPGWRDFPSYNRLRGEFTDFRRGDEGRLPDSQLAAVGWSQNDHDLIRLFFFADREVYRAENLRTLAACFATPPLTPDAVRSVGQRVRSSPVLAPLVVAALAFLLFLPPGRWLTGGLAWGAGVACFLAVLASGHYCPQHFIQSLLGYAAVTALLLADDGPRPAWRWPAVVVGCLLLAWCARYELKAQRAASSEVRRMSAAFHEQLHDLAPDPTRLYVIWGGALPIQYQLPFASPDRLRGLRLFPLGCLTNTPTTDRMLRDFGIDDLMSALVTRDDVFLISEPGVHNPLLTRYYAERRGLSVAMTPTFDPPNRLFRVYRVRPVAD